MVEKFDFKREIFYRTLYALWEYPVVFLYGARHTGKTVCLKQLAGELSNAEYYDIKCMEDLEAYDLSDRIKECIIHNEPRTFLVDNPAYCSLCDSVLHGLIYAFDELDENVRLETRLVFAGGSPRAMESWASRFFYSDAAQIVSDFPSYSEWLKFYDASDNAENRERFMFGKSELNSGFVGFDEFLSDCLEEAEVVLANAAEIIIGHFYELLDKHILKDILFAALARELADLKNNDVVSRHLNAFSALAPETLEQGCKFLDHHGLITSVAKPLEAATARVSHPFICAELLKDAFGEHIPPELKHAAMSLYF